MRQIGTLASERDARRFSDYILTRGVKTQIEPEHEGWAVWVYDEDQTGTARQELEAFREQADDPRYDNAAATAERLRKQEEEANRRARRQYVDVRQRWNRPVVARAPLAVALIVASLLVTLGSRFGATIDPLISNLAFARMIEGPGEGWYLPRGSTGFEQIRQGQVWRLVTPVLIHMHVLHLAFNMYMFFYFGTAVETARGTWRFLLFVLVMAVLSNLGQALFKGPAFGGMSGVVYGMFGYVWMKSRYDPGSGFRIDPTTVFILVGWFLFGIAAGDRMAIANWAHGVGLGVGMLIGYGPKLWHDVQRR